MVTEQLAKWLTAELETRHWSMRELARRAGIAHPTVSLVMSQQQRPTWAFCVAIAKALDVPEDDVFVLAELKATPPQEVARQKWWDEVTRMVAALPDGPDREYAQQAIYDIAKAAYQRVRQEQRGKSKERVKT